MANFINKCVTDVGTNIITKVISGSDTFNFTRIALGSGTVSASDIYQSTALANEEISLDIESMSHKNNRCDFNAMLYGANVTNSFTWTEVGIFGEDSSGNEILYFYGLNSEIDTVSSSLDQKLIQVSTYLSNSATVTCTISPTIDLEELKITTDGSVLGTYNGKIATEVKITPTVIGAQIDLSKATIVEFGDSTGLDDKDVYIDFHSANSKFSDYAVRVKAESGTNNFTIETSSGTGTIELNGKVTVNGKEVYDESDTIPVTNGGTGKTTITAGALVTGNGTNTLNELSGTGALYATTKNNPVFGTLPISMGGTGATTHTSGAVILGNGTGSFQEKTGKGAFYAATAGSPVFGTLPTSLGGTGKTSYTANRLLFASNTSTIGQVAHPTGEQGFLWSDTTGAPSFMTLSDLIELLRLNGLGGDFVGKTLITLGGISLNTSSKTWTYSNSKGGLILFSTNSNTSTIHTLNVDGTDIYTSTSIVNAWTLTADGAYQLIVPFDSKVTITFTATSGSFSPRAVAYINK